MGAVIMPSNLSLYYQGNVTTAAELKSNFKLTSDLALMGKLWHVNYEDFEENWHYNGTALY